jgi:Uncharacterised nucleotidyltransferase
LKATLSFKPATSCRLRPPLSGALSVILPAPEDSLLLRACLNSNKSGEQACKAWLKQRTELSNELRKESTKAFLPLLFRALQIHGIEIDAALLTILRTAVLREELRTNASNNTCRDVFSIFTVNEIPMIVRGGVALADTVYPDRALRHAHIDVLIPDTKMDRATGLLLSAGFKAVNLELSKFEHASGLHLELHTRLFQIPYDNLPSAEIWARSRSRAVAGLPARVLAPSDSLLHVCGHASYSRSRQSLRWVSDAWFIIDHHRRDLDWELFIECAKRSHLALPLSVMLGYLAKSLDAPIPPMVLDRLCAAAFRTDATEREAALWGTLASVGRDQKKLVWAADDWRARAFVLKWLLMPSPHYLRWAEQFRHFWLLPLYYAYRPLRYVARSFALQCKNRLYPKMPQGRQVVQDQAR